MDKETFRLPILGVSFIAGLALLLYAFLAWRFDLIVFGFSNYTAYFWYGLAATITPALLYRWGHTIGGITSFLSALILIGGFVVGFLFDKADEYEITTQFVVNCIIGFCVGLAAMFFGAHEHEFSEENQLDSNSKSSRSS